MSIRKLKPIEERDPYAAAVLDAFDKLESDPKEIWLVLDEKGWPIFCAGWQRACHEHINDAINEHDIDDAAKWKVRQAALVPNAEIIGSEAVRVDRRVGLNVIYMKRNSND